MVFLAHALGLCQDAYRPFLDALDRAAAISFDFRNQGRSASVPPEMREALRANPDHLWEWSVNDAAAVASSAVFQRCMSPSGTLAFGHSLGGAAMLECVALRQAIPGVCGLVLFEPIIFSPDLDTGISARPDNPMSIMTRKRRSRFASDAEMKARLGSKPPMMNFDPRALDGYSNGGVRHEDGTSVLSCDPEYESLGYSGRNRVLRRCLEQTPPCPVPILILAGEHSTHNRQPGHDSAVDLYREFARMLTADFQLVPGVGHFGPLEKPELIAGMINEWFAKLNPSSSRL